MSVSVVIPVFNGELTIGKALASIEGQTVKPMEIVVVDDGSTDATAEVIQNYQSEIPIRYYFQENKRQAAARNLGAAKSKGDWLAFLDCDDVWLPKKLEIQLDHLRGNPELEAVIGNYRIIEDITQKKQTDFVPEIISGQDFSPATLLTANFFWLPVVLIKRSKFLELGGFDESFRNAEDIDFGFRFCKTAHYQVFPEVVALYLRRPFSSSQQEIHDINGQKKFYNKVLSRSDLTERERLTALDRLQFWLEREELFLIRRTAVIDGQWAGLKRFRRDFLRNKKSLKLLGLGLLLLIPGSISYFKSTRWKNLDFKAGS